jgi:pimeloyl-ACP methyl ester carboxylesterase
MIGRSVAVLLTLLLGLGLPGCAPVEQALLFHPLKSSPADYEPPPPPIQDLALRTADGLKIHARWCPCPGAKGAILFCPGNAGNLDYRALPIRILQRELGESVLIFDYPGYGRSEGQPSEAGCCAAADAAWNWLVEAGGIAPERIILFGESLGGGVAVEQASRRPHRALVLARTFASVPAMAEARIAAFAGPLVTNRFDNESRLQSCTRPVFIAQADQDRVIPFAHGERLRAACTGPAELYRLHGLDHNDLLPDGFYAALREFLQTRAGYPGCAK